MILSAGSPALACAVLICYDQDGAVGGRASECRGIVKFGPDAPNMKNIGFGPVHQNPLVQQPKSRQPTCRGGTGQGPVTSDKGRRMAFGRFLRRRPL